MMNQFLLMVSLLQCVAPYKMYQKKIPNGASVPLPCKPGNIFEGVGHFNDEGTGSRNNFGLDFAAAGHKWTKELCQKDSDGDRRTNGQELCDPDCVWRENEVTNTTDNLSHPGICDPWNSPPCTRKKLLSGKYKIQGDWLPHVCKKGGFDCPAIKEPDVGRLAIRLPSGTSVPAKETTYKCHIFNLSQHGVPEGQDFHVIAVTPIINNTGVLHHMALLGCTDKTDVKSEPYECGMSASPTCIEVFHVWTVGTDGECYHPDNGVRIGRNGFKIVAIQVHWYNPGGTIGLKDSSGLIIHYTPKLRKFDAGVLTIGSASFHLPPKRQQVIVHGTCAASCTKQYFRGPIKITSVWNHMHYAGTEMSIEINRNGTFKKFITNDKFYSYDSPEIYLYPEPFLVLPGDEFHSTCVYNTMNRNRKTFYGDATSDEMCYGFLTYYPKQNVSVNDCSEIAGVSICNSETFGNCENVREFYSKIEDTEFFQEVSKNCKSFNPCYDECAETIVKYFRSEPCLQGNIWEFGQYFLIYRGRVSLLSRLASCKVEIYMIMNPYLPTAVEGNGASDDILKQTSVLLLTTIFGVFQLLK